jgi:hypothetical protein
VVEVGGGGWRAVPEAGDRRSDGPGDVEPGTFGFGAQAPGPAAESGRGGQLAEQEVLLGAQPAGPLGVMPLIRLGEFGVEFGQAVPVGGPGLRVEDVVGGRPGHVVQIAVLDPGGGAPSGGAPGGGGELHQFQGGQLTAGVADEQVQVAQAEAVRRPDHRVTVADQPVVAVTVQGQGARDGRARLAEDVKQRGHAAFGGDGPRLSQRGRGGRKILRP